MRIYVAGPYSADSSERIEENVWKAVDAGIALYKLGHIPFIPHLTHFVDERARDTGERMEWADYIQWDIGWLEVCEALLFLGPSRGACIELEAAKKMHKSIYYDLTEVPSGKPGSWPPKDNETESPSRRHN